MGVNLSGLGFSSYPISIGELKEQLIGYDENAKVFASDGSSIVAKYHNYRGDYEAIALSYCLDTKKETITVKELIAVLNKALDEGTMEGCRGGLFEIASYTNVYLAYEDCSGSPIVGVIHHNGDVYLMLYERY